MLEMQCVQSQYIATEVQSLNHACNRIALAEDAKKIRFKQLHDAETINVWFPIFLDKILSRLIEGKMKANKRKRKETVDIYAETTNYSIQAKYQSVENEIND